MRRAEIEALNSRFGVPQRVEVLAGNGGLPKVRVTTPWAAAEVYLHGAQLTSWQPAQSEEVLFVSQESHWEDGQAIRGGIPVCFPWFRAKADEPAAPSHGTVRTKEWRLESVETEGEQVVVALATENDEAGRRWWPHEFRAVLRMSIGASLRLELQVTNTGESAFQFEEALHTYFRVGAADKVRVGGLDGAAYLDNTDGNRRKKQSGELIFRAKTDNAYLDTEGAVEIVDAVRRRRIRTEKVNSGTTVVWNPWQDGAATIGDLGNDEWREFVCVEASNILGSAVRLAPGEEHRMEATIRVDAERE